ncbi:hypothetical protein AGMMS50229_20890 [Campylobacterota bacterium]|nr:hypothetical protein AGMMS50229_20890 [Campylobacterota bacterium]
MNTNDIKDSILNALASDDGKVILITGGWGTGKTHFITNEILPKLGEDKYITISLFGLTSVDELKKLIFSQILNKNNFVKKLSEKLDKVNSIKQRWNIGKGLSEVINRLSLDLPGVQFSLSDLNFLEYVIDKDPNTTFVFDDFERISSKSSIDEFLGFFNYLSECKKQNIILLCNESEIFSEVMYRQFKEKVINKTFFFNPSIDEIEHFIFDGKTSQELRGIIKEYVFPIFRAEQNYAKSINIRTIKKCIDNIKEFWEHNIWNEISFDDTNKIHGLQALVVLTFENDKATLKSNLEDYVDSYWSFPGNAPNEAELNKQKFVERLKEEYGIRDICSYIRQYYSLFIFIHNGYFDFMYLKLDFEDSIFNTMKTKFYSIPYKDEKFAYEFQNSIRNVYLIQTKTVNEFSEAVLCFRYADSALAGTDDSSKFPPLDPDDKEMFLTQFKIIIDNMTPRDLILLRYDFDDERGFRLSTDKSKSLDFIRNDIDTILGTEVMEAYRKEVGIIIKNREENYYLFAEPYVKIMLNATENTDDEDYIMHILISRMNGKYDYSNTIKTYLDNKLNTNDKIIKQRYSSYLNEYNKMYQLRESLNRS